MNACIGCKLAQWKKTEKGRLHPDGSGQCMYVVELPKLPASMAWSWSFYGEPPKPRGGGINRHIPHPKSCGMREPEKSK